MPERGGNGSAAGGSPVDISSVAFWSRTFDERERSFARLRAEAPVSWHPQLETPGLPRRLEEPGFWAVTTADLVAAASRRHDVFSSELGQVSLRPTPLALHRNMLVMDPPLHTAYRRVIGTAFTPRRVAALRDGIGRRARQIVLRARQQREFDLVQQVAARLPLLTIADLLGLPASMREGFADVADAYVGGRVPQALPPGTTAEAWVAQQAALLTELVVGFAGFRRASPGEDLMTDLVQGRVDGRPLTDEEVLSTVLLLVVAGDDTTKQASALSILALERHPDQRAWLLEDFDARFDGAFDELMRWVSPILVFARTASADTELGGRRIARGDKVGLFYCSANRDASRFARPDRLDLVRNPNRHLAFGGGGVHFCLGASIARAQIGALVRETFTRMPDLVVGDPRWRFGEFVHAVDALPASRGSRPAS